MVSLQTILNPVSSRSETPPSFLPRSTESSPGFSTVTRSSSRMSRPLVPGVRTVKELNNMAKSKIRGIVQYPPFENLREPALSEVRHFRVDPFGNIAESCLHIPYNSGKKDFYEKTGRESFEVFRYSFFCPGQETEYTVMWDYNVGLVRMTPFFKCCNYGKTIPAKMLNANQGLKEITHSITGGAIIAQGYWMPYQCARAVCATFCYHIAGALIPIFGPGFPSQCTPPDSPNFGMMVISPALIQEATRDAEISRRQQSTNMTSTFHNATSYPRQEALPVRGSYIPEERNLPYRPRLVCDPQWATDHAAEAYHLVPNSASPVGNDLHSYMITSPYNSGWTAANIPRPQIEHYPQPHPDRSAVPPEPLSQPYNTSTGSPSGLKRRLEYNDLDYAYEGTPSPQPCISPAIGSVVASPARNTITSQPLVRDVAQNNAALLLVELSMRAKDPTAHRGDTPPIGSVGTQTPDRDIHRRKRHRASSL